MKTVDLRKNERVLDALLRRRVEKSRAVEERVKPIIDQVRARGDRAVMDLTVRFDSKRIVDLGIVVSEREIDEAFERVRAPLLRALRVAAKNITEFHRHQVVRSWTRSSNGLTVGQRFAPLARVGIYVPGGKAAYPSTVLMNAVPASVAGVPEIVMTTPCDGDGRISDAVLVAAHLAGVKEIYRIGGAQAIAALAYGTGTIRRVDKITGPGNSYVAAAKRLVFGDVGIDSIAGPTEVVIVTDGSARPAFVAADLIAQAEHDEQALPICISTSAPLLSDIKREVRRQLAKAPRRSIAAKSLGTNGLLLCVKSLEQAAAVVNRIAPEHCEILTTRPRELARAITSAGALFVGPWSTEALGDYVAGPNHTLPTAGTARFASALGVTDFVRFSTVLECSPKRFRQLAPFVETLAEAEGLYGHAASVRIRRNPDA